MQFDTQRAFPYPVLRPDVDDYIDGEFQATVDFYQSEDMQDFAFEASFHLSVPEIMQRIECGEAEFVLVVSCRETFFRERFASEISEMRVSLPSGKIRGEVEALPYIVVKKPIIDFSSKLINPEFGPGPFAFQQASVLAIDRPRVVYVDREAFKPVSSVFELVQSTNVPDHEWQLGFTENKVQIQLSKAMKEKVDNFRTDRKNKSILLNSIYFAAVMQCLILLKNSDGEYDEQRWAIVMQQQCNQNGINLQKDEEYRITQTLMRFPLTLMDAYLFVGGGVE